MSRRADFCVGYFNLRGWKALDACIESWNGSPGQQCRLLVGMHRLPHDELKNALSITSESDPLDNQSALRLKKMLAEEFRNQLMLGAPTNEDEAGLRRLANQLRQGKVVVKLYLRHTLHAKLYLCFRQDPNNPVTGFLGSSNLTFSGLSKQGELNVDVLDQDATQKLAKWFEDRWKDRWCIDITKELIQVIEESWAREEVIPPDRIYIKIAYHLAQEARAGLSQFRIPASKRTTHSRRHRCAQRGPESSGRRRHRKLRPALGHHSPHPARPPLHHPRRGGDPRTTDHLLPRPPPFALTNAYKKRTFICMRTTLNIDDDLLAEAMRSTGQSEKTTVVRMGLEALIETAAARRLAALGGTMGDFNVPKRRRKPAATPPHGPD